MTHQSVDFEILIFFFEERSKTKDDSLTESHFSGEKLTNKLLPISKRNMYITIYALGD